MVSSGEEPVDKTPGGLVWVRRRNGAWWPGQILDPDELPEGCATAAPRPGTPVKLLGREDASVDWYNLEKSKRVKAFHCKEYDHCIKRVQLLSLSSNKRAAKYARREDAILHALELENARLGTQDAASHPTEDDDKDSKSGQENGLGYVDSANNESKQYDTDNDSEDEGSKGVKRTRGLKDLGMGIATRKRAHIGHVQELLKRKKRRPITKVMECATMVPAPTKELSNESKKNSSVVINNNSDSNGVSSENGTLLSEATPKHKLKNKATFSVSTVPENGSCQDVPVTEQKNSPVNISDASMQTEGGSGAQSSESSDVEAISVGNEAHNESGSNLSGTANASCGWRLKGKRNTRRRKLYLNVSGAGREASLARGTPRVKSRPSTAVLGETSSTRLLPLRQSRFTVNPKYDNSDYSLDNRTASGLYDVKVEVKTSHRPQHVPYISLMSKLTGQPIIGHPLQVTVLKDDKEPELDFDLNEDVAPDNAGKQRRRGGGTGKKRKRTQGSSRAQTSQTKSRRNGLMLKKTRKLSSLTGSRRLSHEEMRPKPILEKLKGPSLACVPLNVVFSRINADLTSTMRAPPRLNETTSV